ncbi:hypothetical protein C8Q78DRAFT_1051799 [Trametes maxima]|nr:hypothetical protein C8Q78DRAFT_1051799 [Trametes maxima]
MIDEKAGAAPPPPPPAYGSSPSVGYGSPLPPAGSPPGQSYGPPQGPGYGPPQGYGTPPGAQPYPTQPGPFVYTDSQQLGYGAPPVPGNAQQQQYHQHPSYASAAPSQAGYPPQAGAQAPPTTGAQYQQQLFAMCAAGQHDVTTKHGIAGIIGAILLFPIGLLCLFLDVEKRCVRCGARLG